MEFSKKYSLTVMYIIDVLIKEGGAERSLYRVAKNLERKGYKAIICCLQGGELVQKMRSEGMMVVNLDIKKIYNLKGLFAIFRLANIARQNRVSVIMSYHESSDFLGLLSAKLSRVPIISNRRDMGIKLQKRHINIYRIINRFFDKITAVSYAVKEYVVNTQYLRASNITVIPNGVELFSKNDQFSDKDSGIEIDKLCLNICCIGNIRPIKGQRQLIDAVSAIATEFPNVRLLFVGMRGLDEDYYDSLQRYVKNLRLEKVVKFTGAVPYHHIPSLLTYTDIYVSPSLSEGMSNAILEAMSASLPVIATSVGGSSEIVEDGKTGYLVPPDDSHSLTEALIKLLRNSELRLEMGRRGRSLVETKFSIKNMVKKYEDLMQYVYLRKKVRKNLDSGLLLS